MAQIMYCDAAGCAEVGTVLVQRLGTPDVKVYCDPDFLDLCATIVMAQADQEAQSTDDEAVARLQRSGATAPDPESAAGSDEAPAAVPEPSVPADAALAAMFDDAPEGYAVEAEQPDWTDQDAQQAESIDPQPGPDDPTDEDTDEPVTPRKRRRRRAAVIA